MRKGILILLFISTLLFAAEFRDGTLYLEVNLISGPALELCAEEILISDESGLFKQNLAGRISIAAVAEAQEICYGILDDVREGGTQPGDDNAIVSNYFAWEDGHLVIKSQNQYFLEQSFTDPGRAREYAAALAYPAGSVKEIPIVNSRIIVRDSLAQDYYYESPLRLFSDELWPDNELPYDGEFVIRVIDGNLVLNQMLPLEEYIAGVVPNEIGNYSPAEALKAQAVAARSHAVSLLLYNRHKKDGYDLCNGTHCQVYKGKYRRNPDVEEAVICTAAEIMTVQERVADATYHSSCGGKTDSSQAIWNGAYIPHLSGSSCIDNVDKYDLSSESGAASWIMTRPDTRGMSSWESGTLAWEKSTSRELLARNLGLFRIDSIRITKRGRSGRILKMQIKGDKSFDLIGEYRIRQAFGSLPSSFFYFKNNARKSTIYPSKTITVIGRGSGHGVGMCQVGALRMARTGSDYEDILECYYPGTKLTTEWIYDE